MATSCFSITVLDLKGRPKTGLGDSYFSLKSLDGGSDYDLTESSTDAGLYYSDMEDGNYDFYENGVKNDDRSPVWHGSEDTQTHVDGHGSGAGAKIAEADIVDRAIAADKKKIYLFSGVTVTGTPGSPQTFTSGSSPLDNPDEGGSCPEFTNVPQVNIHSPQQDHAIYIATAPSLDGTDVTFDLACSASGAGGTKKCNIEIISLD